MTGFAVGHSNKIGGNLGGAFGDGNTVVAERSYAIGNSNQVSGKGGFAAGNQATVTAEMVLLLVMMLMQLSGILLP